MNKSYRITIFTILLIVSAYQTGISSSRNYFARPSLGFAYGSWKPINISNEPAVTILPSSKTSPFVELFFISPWLKTYAVRVGLGYWQQTEATEIPGVNSVLIVPLAIDLKYQIIPQVRLSPYTSYGITFYYGAENPKGQFPQIIGDTTELGWGASLGAGLNYSISSRWAIGAEFQYLYARLGHKIGQTDNYSGPKVTVCFFYLF